MKVRVWINGAEGAFYDFEMVESPRAGDRISIAVGGESAEGIVASVSWHLQAIEKMAGDLALDGDPAGSVTIVHVVCEPTSEAFHRAGAIAEADASQASH